MAQSKASHTPTPWEVWKDDEGQFGIVDKVGFFVTFAFPIDGDGSGVVQGENADFIVRAVNSYDEMLAALNLMDAFLYATAPESNERQIVQLAIAKAEGRAHLNTKKGLR